MKTKFDFFALALLAFLSTLNYQLSTCSAQGTAFTYQGQLQNDGGPANGTFNLQFTLYTNVSGGTSVAGPVTNSAVIITNGLFTVQINLGASVWNGSTNWLQIGVETNGGDAFVTLSPRQEVTPVPYGIYAENAITLAGGTAIGTGSGNSISSSGAVYSFIGGGQDNTILAGDNEAVIGGGANNTNSGGYATIGGGVLNVVSAGAATVGGGQGNTASGIYATVGGGIINTASGPGSFIGGGGYDGTYSGNLAQGSGATIGGGIGNSVSSSTTDGFIGGGINNKIQVNSSYTTISAGNGNQIQNNSSYSTIGGGGGNVINANNSASAIAGGSDNSIQSGDDNAFIGGGYLNLIASNLIHSTIGGGVQNKIQANSSYATIAGGSGNVVQSNASYSTIAGGGGNTIDARNSASAIVGGSGNTIYGDNDNSSIGGGYQNYIADGDSFSTIGGGEGNQVYLGGGATYTTIAGGNGNTILDSYTFIGGGYGNYIYPGGTWAAISGGSNNVAYGACSTVPGGANNAAQGNYSFAAGRQAQATYQGDFVWADSQNAAFASTANDQFLIRAQGGVGIGTASPAAGLHVFSTNQIPIEVEGTSDAVLRLVPQGCTPSDMVARCDGGMDWYADYPNGTILMSLLVTPSILLDLAGDLDAVNIRANGNVTVVGTTLEVGDTTVEGNLTVNNSITSCGYNLCSDRNLKRNLVSIDPQKVLDKISALPITKWQYNATPGAEHLGPMAQDFHAAFGLNGQDDTHISVVDEGGVALAAIKGLNQKLNEKDAQIQNLEKKLDQLQAAVKSLEQKNRGGE